MQAGRLVPLSLGPGPGVGTVASGGMLLTCLSAIVVRGDGNNPGQRCLACQLLAAMVCWSQSRNAAVAMLRPALASS